MKMRLMICIAILAMGMNVLGQDNISTSQTHDNNEIRLNVVMSIAGFPEINYERYITDNMGIGLAAAISLEKPKDMTLRSMVLPYYRVYFGEKKAAGFFIEGNMAVVGEKNVRYTDVLDPTYNTYYSAPNGYNSATSFGFGAAIGYKFLTRNGVIGELCLGGGRLFGNSIDNAFPRIGVCIGKRF